MFVSFLVILGRAVSAAPTAFSGSYSGPSGKFDGWKPQSGTGHPVFIWVPGTLDEYWTASNQHMVYQMALRNFVAVSVKYNNGGDEKNGFNKKWVCDESETGVGKSKNIFQGATSALGKLCAMPEADCSKGIAIAGHSQGAFIALQSAAAAKAGAPSYAVTAILAASASLGGGNKGCAWPQTPSLSCIDGPALDENLPRSKRRYIIGEDDYITGGGPDMVYGENKQMSGYDCGASNDCLQLDGSGYYIVKGSEFEKATCTVADHAIFWTGDNAHNGPLTCDFVQGSHNWSMTENFDWLAKAATPANFIVPAVGIDFKGSPTPCGAACTTAPGQGLCELKALVSLLTILGSILGCCCCCCCAGAAFFAFRRRKAQG